MRELYSCWMLENEDRESATLGALILPLVRGMSLAERWVPIAIPLPAKLSAAFLPFTNIEKEAKKNMAMIASQTWSYLRSGLNSRATGCST